MESVIGRHPGADEMDAYERLLGDAMEGDQTLFAREDYVEEAWRIVDPVLKAGTPVYNTIRVRGGRQVDQRFARPAAGRIPLSLGDALSMEIDPTKRRVLILGGGFAGAYTALHLEKHLASAPDVEIVLVAKENFVLFTPMLHEVAGADVNVTDIVQPLRKMLRRTRVEIADVESIDLAKKVVARPARRPGEASST